MADPPDILLTNYVMLELVLTRRRERDRLVHAARGLWFLVLDELHTYRGRQGADVAFLVRRTREACASPNLECVGTSATMTSRGTAVQQRAEVAKVASRLFGTVATPENVIGESLRRVTADAPIDRSTLADGVAQWAAAEALAPNFAEFRADPLAGWVETTFGLELDDESGRLIRRRRPLTLTEAASQLAGDTAAEVETCRAALQTVLRAGSSVIDPDTTRPVFAFRLHQFVSKGDNVYATIETPERRYLTSRKQIVSPDSTDAQRKILVPLAFCRECGQDYLVARRTVSGFEAREDSDSGGDEAGYLYASDDQPWPASLDIAVADGRLPYSWTVLADDGGTILSPGKERYLPEVVHVSPDGTEVASDEGVPAAWVTTPFRFRLRCRVSYERNRGQDFAQLAKANIQPRHGECRLASSQ